LNQADGLQEYSASTSVASLSQICPAFYRTSELTSIPTLLGIIFLRTIQHYHCRSHQLYLQISNRWYLHNKRARNLS